MTRHKNSIWLFFGFLLLVIALIINMSVGSKYIPIFDVLRVFYDFNEDSYFDYMVRDTRFPRSVIAIFVAANMAVCGCVLQGVSNNPLASPSLLGITSGAVFAVVFLGFYLSIPLEYHGFVAFGGGIMGFACCYIVAKMAGLKNDPRGMVLILAGAIVSSLLGTIANALVLADQGLWTLLRNWIAGDINHVYMERLNDLWLFGVIPILILFYISRPLTLIILGTETAQATGVNVKFYMMVALTCAIFASTAATAVIGPVGFFGLVVPHMVRPLVGVHFRYAIPMNIFVGSTVGLVVDSIARTAFLPFIVNTSVIMQILGGIVFVLMVRRYYINKQVSNR